MKSFVKSKAWQSICALVCLYFLQWNCVLWNPPEFICHVLSSLFSDSQHVTLLVESGGGGHSVCFPMSLPVLFCFAFVFFMTGMLIWVTKNLSIVLIFAPLMIKLFCIMALNSILIKEVQKNLFPFEFFLFSLFPYVCIICYFGV